MHISVTLLSAWELFLQFYREKVCVWVSCFLTCKYSITTLVKKNKLFLSKVKIFQNRTVTHSLAQIFLVIHVLYKFEVFCHRIVIFLFTTFEKSEEITLKHLLNVFFLLFLLLLFVRISAKKYDTLWLNETKTKLITSLLLITVGCKPVYLLNYFVPKTIALLPQKRVLTI